MIQDRPAAEADGRLLHLRLLAEARRVTSAWVEGEMHPAELIGPATRTPPTTLPMPAVTASQPPNGRSAVTRIRPGLTSAAVLTGVATVLSMVTDLDLPAAFM